MIKLTEPVIELVQNYIQKSDDDLEAGGMLIGRENISNDNLIVEYATEPMPGDTRKRTRYIRKDEGHGTYYMKLFADNDGIYRYVGEWHTHPQTIPEYSVIDCKNWKEIARGEKYYSAHYHLIAGTEAIRIWKVSCRKRYSIELLCTVQKPWKTLLL